MKLELKHLAGYLPYGLKFDGKRNGWVSFDGNIKTLCPIDLDGRWEIIKPILRPLSDLTKEIEVNGEKFVPSQEYNYLRFEEISTFKGGCNAMKFIQARELELLYEMHFDIYGLIPDLAIDINTL